MRRKKYGWLGLLPHEEKLALNRYHYATAIYRSMCKLVTTKEFIEGEGIASVELSLDQVKTTKPGWSVHMYICNFVESL